MLPQVAEENSHATWQKASSSRALEKQSGMDKNTQSSSMVSATGSLYFFICIFLKSLFIYQAVGSELCPRWWQGGGAICGSVAEERRLTPPQLWDLRSHQGSSPSPLSLKAES